MAFAVQKNRRTRGGAINAGKRLNAAFARAARSCLSQNENENEDEDEDEDNSTSDEEEDDWFDEDEDDSSFEEDEDDGTFSGTFGEDDGTFDEDDSTFQDEEDSTFDEDGEDSSVDDYDSIVYGNVQALVEDFHDLMTAILKHNSALCLVQFTLNKKNGKENNGTSLIRAMFSWRFNLEDREESLGDLPHLSHAVLPPTSPLSG
ncbi:hypothetical protein QBC46DRAFT_407675 [Diplogelasinospora grovesii]|uniref:Uncharacterized protein n=1 Tax=Diplogelasinospora grovesii TaxID=303347 RepID=A0AAN6N9M0_9PEZI|nr:hypothetical protein QBC46DRAFT_407675 [Diplogelasinospora grovesii]